MADLSVLKLSLSRIAEAQVPPADVPELIVAETAGRARKTVLAYLKTLLPPAFLPIECIVPNVHLGDGRQLGRGGRAWVPRDVAELIIERGFAVRVP